jgi:hypothetical protein
MGRAVYHAKGLLGSWFVRLLTILNSQLTGHLSAHHLPAALTSGLLALLASQSSGSSLNHRSFSLASTLLS